MPQKKKDLKLSEPIAEFAEMDPQDPQKPEVAAAPKRTKKSTVRSKAKKPRRMNFDRYARAKGFRATHIPGMRAFTKNPNIPRTLEAWDKFFEGY